MADRIQHLGEHLVLDGFLEDEDGNPILVRVPFPTGSLPLIIRVPERIRAPQGISSGRMILPSQAAV